MGVIQDGSEWTAQIKEVRDKLNETMNSLDHAHVVKVTALIYFCQDTLEAMPEVPKKHSLGEHLRALAALADQLPNTATD